MKLFILFTFYLMIIETSQMDCCFMLRGDPNFDGALTALRNCINNSPHIPVIYHGNLTDINILKNTVKGFPMQYRCPIKSDISVSQELVKKLCGDNINVQEFKESIENCVEIFYRRLKP
ncbi:uncharacterized protein LOC126896840 isoform X2 [Daktulosphaira vitifoliae]|uniref:uncharacterized protein LOC126896840 isoform X2 n=1 Tax=Daktulosphaira vitifoliae TaxID=58002 RepID=UPI0021AA2A78|nr:uncharacterized protein LOC126896840 isoform X2 [Daktulosphaira vitifoliae]XP_050525923.1 uncharacterized protein LOC126896840 isoform X2 [Daktulosphaira vitifoliae]XP_050525924.1 uncharacterized protein LOC126896840 isoform X2 [Daktulosphaira vitifoliae]